MSFEELIAGQKERLRSICGVAAHFSWFFWFHVMASTQKYTFMVGCYF
jgi:hypothetical protein